MKQQVVHKRAVDSIQSQDLQEQAEVLEAQQLAVWFLVALEPYNGVHKLLDHNRFLLQVVLVLLVELVKVGHKVAQRMREQQVQRHKGQVGSLLQPNYFNWLNV